MCGRFVSKDDFKELAKTFSVTRLTPDFSTPSYNVAPTDEVPIIVEHADHERELLLARFGMPMVAGSKYFPLLNIQSEKAGNRKDLATSRCIIPANGFYEWAKRSPTDKQPYYFSPTSGVFALAGVWKAGKTPGFTIFTTAANEQLAPIHNRMPVILGHNTVSLWLAPETPKSDLMFLMRPYPAKLMQSWQVSKAVNSPKNKHAGCINSL